MNVLPSLCRFVQPGPIVGAASGRRFIAMAMLTLLGFAPPSRATAGTVIAGASAAGGLSASISVASVSIISLPTQPSVSGTAPGAYNLTDSLASISAGVLNTATIDTGILNVAASSDVAGTAGPNTATASSSVTGLNVSVGLNGNLFSITSGTDVLTETATVSGTYGALAAAGSLQIVGNDDVVISVLGKVEATLHAGDVIAPNTTIDIAGVGSIILNEQTPDSGSDGTSYAGLTANLLDVKLAPTVLGVQLADISLVIDGTHAALTASAVPEPSSLTLMGAAGLLGLVAYRRRMIRSR